jgi:eukaryotic-like serine/threonine-protein kinase
MSKVDTSTSTGIPITADLDTEMGRIALDMGLLTRTELDTCRELQKQSSDPNHRSLAHLMVENKFVTIGQLQRIKKTQEERSKEKKGIPGYEIIKELGKGAMARVWMAKQLSLDRIVAIKVLPRKMSENPDFVDRFYKEGKAAARLSHNNMVQAIDVGQSPTGYHYFVMEYIEGHSLYDEMAPPPAGKGRKFSENEALDIIIQIGEALEHAHQRGLIHRDVKPKNIMITPSGVAKLTDLGLARGVDDKQAAESEAGKAYGTPYYISPEQIRGDVDIDFRADIYSLGATFYHVVTGRPPFEGDSPSAVMHKHLKQQLIPADHVNQALSSGIGEVIDVAMAKKREERYQSTTDMLEDLRALRRGEAPVNVRRNVNLSEVAALEEANPGDTVDLEPPPPPPSIWDQPLVTPLVVGLSISAIVNVAMVVLYLLKK